MDMRKIAVCAIVLAGSFAHDASALTLQCKRTSGPNGECTVIQSGNTTVSPVLVYGAWNDPRIYNWQTNTWNWSAYIYLLYDHQTDSQKGSFLFRNTYSGRQVTLCATLGAERKCVTL